MYSVDFYTVRDIIKPLTVAEKKIFVNILRTVNEQKYNFKYNLLLT